MPKKTKGRDWSKSIPDEPKERLFQVVNMFDADYRNGGDNDKYCIGARDAVFTVLYAFDLADEFYAWRKGGDTK